MARWLVLLLVLGATAAEAQSTIGPGTPCTFTVPSPTTNADGTPLTSPLTEYRFYLDPPVGGPVLGSLLLFGAMLLGAALVPAPPEWVILDARPCVYDGPGAVYDTGCVYQ